MKKNVIAGIILMVVAFIFLCASVAVEMKPWPFLACIILGIMLMLCGLELVDKD